MITIENCLQIGGHCFPDDPVGQVPGSPIFLFQCKHCGWAITKIRREAWVPIITGEIESSAYESSEVSEEHLGSV